MLHRRIAWTLAILLFVGLLVWWFVLDPGWQVRYVSVGKRVFVLAFTFMTIALVLPAVVAFLLAVIPRPRVPYLQRLGGRLPWCFTAWFMLMGLTYALPRSTEWKKKGYVQLMAAGLQDVVVPYGIPCERVHDGRFSGDQYSFERIGEHQTERRSDGTVSKYQVRWNSSCEYLLVNEDQKEPPRLVKVVAVGPDWYDCVLGDSTTSSLIRLHIDR